MIWNTPEGWKEFPGSGFQLMSFEVSSEKNTPRCFIVVLQGDGGGIAANVRRWASQLDLIPFEGDILDDFISKQETFKTVENRPGILIDFSTVKSPGGGIAPMTIMVSMVFLPHTTVFLKMVGDTSLCKENRDKLFSLSCSLREG